jgi:hypothetical protein
MEFIRQDKDVYHHNIKRYDELCKIWNERY